MAEPILSITSQAPGALPNGTRVVKLPTPPEERDGHKPGALATVIGSIANNGLVPEMPHIRYMYCLIWDDTPGLPVFCADFKIEKFRK